MSSQETETKSRREVIEDQLKELQADISSLSNKLSMPNTLNFMTKSCKYNFLTTFYFLQ